MPAESELFKDKIEVSLDGRQIFYLFFGGAVIVALVFVLGVMVGKRVESRAHVECGAASRAQDPLAALDALGQEDDLAFPEALAADDVGDRKDAERALIGAIDEQVLAAGENGEEEDAAEKAAAEKARAEKARAEKAAAEKAVAEKAAAEKARAEKAAVAEKAAAEKAAAEKAAAEKARADRSDDEDDEPAAASAIEQDGSDSEENPGGARFTLQLSSFRDRAEADSFYDRLKTAGYEPYIIEAEVPGKGTWYRVRLGEYTSWESAVQAKKDFEGSQHVIAYVTRIK